MNSTLTDELTLDAEDLSRTALMEAPSDAARDAKRGVSVGWRALAWATLIVAAMSIDVRVATWVHEHGPTRGVGDVLRIVRLPGNYGFTFVIALAVLVRLRGRWWPAVEVILASGIASALAAVIKLCAGRCRPFRGPGAFEWDAFPIFSGNWMHSTNLSFPSGDATLAFATAAAVAHVVPSWRWIAFTWAFAVAVARVLQGAHYPSDVMAGAALGTLTVQALVMLMESRRAVRRQPHQMP